MRINLNSNNYIDLDFIDNKLRNVVLIFPGGGYEMTSPREAKPVAQVFQNAGYHTAIYYYRETKHLYPKIIDEGYEVLKILHENELINKIYLIGFSAGGHFASMLMTYHHELVQATILAYPVITSHPLYVYKYLENNLLGENKTQEMVKEISMELQVHHQISPVFIMHTMDDQTVPVENSILMVEALKKHQVYVESRFYQNGRHGVSLGTKEVAFSDMNPLEFEKKYKDLSGWIDLAIQFLERIKQ
ncbi:MAG: alpha/beta hydrolase [Acholeplasmataceae bacterium]|nr:alpha/beta hydrolase [Acholeplasmataceae bacterium]